MAYAVRVTRQGQTTIPKGLRDKYQIKEGDRIIYVDVGDHMAVMPLPKDPLKALEELRLEVKGSIYKMRKEALETAQKLVERKFRR